jgi:uncharacterized cofD-like protein
MNQSRIVSLGGGHGLAAMLSALRFISTELTAIVTVADNGGSSGRLRQEFNSLPPGDLRMALAALCSDDEWGRSWAEIMQYRFTSSGELNGHALGNLLLTALWDRDEDPVQGLDRVGALLKVVGRVLPMAREPLDIEATFRNWEGAHVIRGQKEVAAGKGRLEDLRIIPDNPQPTSEGIHAISRADWITLGPGSWFSSVMPHLLVPEQREAIQRSAAKILIVLNLDAVASAAGDELAGSSPAEHLRIMLRYAPSFRCDIALADHSIASSPTERAALEEIVNSMGGRLVIDDVATHPGSNHHDPRKLISAFRHIMQKEVIR